MSDSAITIANPSEFAPLRTVVMRLAQPFTLDLSRPEQYDAGFQRQLAANRWQPYDHQLVCEQQCTFIAEMRARGIEVLIADDQPGCDGQHYTRDIGFAIDDVFVLGRSRLGTRQRELIGLRPIVERMTKVVHLDAGHIEGGDVMLHDGAVLVGLGEETNMTGLDALQYALRRAGVDREVVPIRFARRGVIHLDTLFNVIAPGVALIHEAAFPEEQLGWFRDRFDLIAVTDEEAMNVEVNTFSLSPTDVVLAERSVRIAAELRARGLTPIPVDYSEVTKIPGSFRCSTLPLVRA